MIRAVAEHRLWTDFFAEDEYVAADPENPTEPKVPDGTFLYLLCSIRNAGAHYSQFVVSRELSAEMRFRPLAEAWRAETAACSSVTEMAMHPAYQQIIGMGREILPVLLKELDREPDHWFWALGAIAGTDPVDPEHRGDMEEMAKAWLDWGRRQGHI